MARSRRRPTRAETAHHPELAAPAVSLALAAASLVLAAALLGGCAAPSQVRPVEEPTEPPPSANAWQTARPLRIGLVVGAKQAEVSGSKEWELRVQGGKRIAQEASGKRLRVARDGAGTIGVFREGEPEPVGTFGVGDTLVLEPSSGGYSGWSGNWYRGTFRIYASNPDGITVVNEVDRESYLRSVLPNEIGTPPQTDFEAVKAQAVAARSYTLAYLGRRADLGFDLYASVEDQVYAGLTRENPQSDRALEATRGEVLLCEGVPIRALYSSACGGRTANVEDVWPWSWTPYLRSVRDAEGPGAKPYCALSASFRWREEWDATAFLTMLAQFGLSANGGVAAIKGDLLDVRVASRSRSGRVQDMVITTTAGDWALHGDRIRWGLRRPGTSAILRSSFFKIGLLRGENGRAARVVATGAGNGHGIGLCQWGAMGMARAGIGYREILSHYYKATRLTRI